MEIFEEPFENILRAEKTGEVLGGGTYHLDTGEIVKCHIILNLVDEWVNEFIGLVDRINILPKGSKVFYDETEVAVGQAEGLAVRLNGRDLPLEIYQTNDVNDLISALGDAVSGKGNMLSWWENNDETVMYFYGASYSEMYDLMKGILDIHPLAQLHKVDQLPTEQLPQDGEVRYVGYCAQRPDSE